MTSFLLRAKVVAMQRKNYILAYGLLSLFFIACLLFIGVRGGLGFLQNAFQVSFFGITKLFPNTTSQDTSLKAENISLTQQLSNMKTLQADNKALRDQFENQTFSPSRLLPARIVGQPSVIPNMIYPEEFIVDAGKKAGVEKGDVVVVKDTAIGQIQEVSEYFAKVMLTTSKNFALSGKDQNSNAAGVVKGVGNGEIVFDAVLLSDTLKVGDLVVSSGSQDMSGRGFPPDILIGKITGVEKNPSSLFQSARLSPVITIQKLHTVFILKNI